MVSAYRWNRRDPRINGDCRATMWFIADYIGDYRNHMLSAFKFANSPGENYRLFNRVENYEGRIVSSISTRSNNCDKINYNVYVCIHCIHSGQGCS